MLKKLRIKFVCINMAIVTVMLSVIFGTIFTFTKNDLENESLQMMRSLAMSPSKPDLPGETPPKEIRLPYFTLRIEQGGKVVASGGGYFDLSDEEFLQEVLKASLNHGKKDGVLDEYGLRFCRVVTPQEQYIVYTDISSERATLRGLIQTCSVIGILSLLVFFAISFFLARWAIKPVEKAWQQQKQFVADASHELKTPLTVILTNAEMLQSPDCDEAARTQLSDNVLVMSHQMRGLVESLLELARVDNGTAKMNFSLLDFTSLVSDAVLPFEPLFFEKGLELQCDTEQNLRVKGSESHLRQVTDILLDNAMKYAYPQGMVFVTAKRRGSHVLLSVANPGDPISPEDLKNIFKRFYRVDKVRSMNHSYGLGLSIAESIVLEHRGKIWAESAGGFNTFHVQLPLQ